MLSQLQGTLSVVTEGLAPCHPKSWHPTPPFRESLALKTRSPMRQVQQGQHLLPFPPHTARPPHHGLPCNFPPWPCQHPEAFTGANTICISVTNQPNITCILAGTTFSVSPHPNPLYPAVAQLWSYFPIPGEGGLLGCGRVEAQGSPSTPGSALPRALLLMRLRWLLEVWDSSVACWWLESTGLVAMMLSLYLFISDSLALSLPEQEELKAKYFRDKDF